MVLITFSFVSLLPVNVLSIKIMPIDFTSSTTISRIRTTLPTTSLPFVIFIIRGKFLPTKRTGIVFRQPRQSARFVKHVAAFQSNDRFTGYERIGTDGACVRIGFFGVNVNLAGCVAFRIRINITIAAALVLSLCPLDYPRPILPSDHDYGYCQRVLLRFLFCILHDKWPNFILPSSTGSIPDNNTNAQGLLRLCIGIIGCSFQFSCMLAY
mmetsp:Transcript_4422/g.9910  ORF Transcript_4422/g.9910 Transcript_4422/m.9910 type:complete len:211 (-) Transcript_4422:439-1071(-)